MTIGPDEIVSASPDQARKLTFELLMGHETVATDSHLLMIWPHETISAALISTKLGTDVKAAIIQAVADVGELLVNRIETNHRLESDEIATLRNWCDLVDYAQITPLSDLGRRLFDAVTTFVDATEDLIPYVARAALIRGAEGGEYNNSDADFQYWCRMLTKGPASQFAFRRVMEIDHDAPELEQALERLWYLQIYNDQEVDTPLLMSSLVSARNGNTELVKRVLSRLGPGVQSIVRDELKRREWTASWVDLVPNLGEPSFPLYRRESFDYAGAKQLLKRILADERILDPDKLEGVPSLLLESLEEYFRRFNTLSTITDPGTTTSTTYCPRLSYPLFPKDGFMSQHDQLFKSIERTERIFFDGVSNLGTLTHSTQDEFVMDTMDSRLPTRARYILGLAFFFCPSARQSEFWSAIPLGKQRAIGLICHDTIWAEERVKDAINWCKEMGLSAERPSELDITLRRYIKDIGCSEQEILGLQWAPEQTAVVVDCILNHLNARAGSQILVRRGFVMGDILIEFLRRRRRYDLVPQVSTMLTPDNCFDESSMKIFPKIDEMTSARLDASFLQKTIALFDLGYIKKIVEGARQPQQRPRQLQHSQGLGDYKIIIIRHDVDVDVGLGFSLPVLPFLFRRLRGPSGADEYWWEYVVRECRRIYGQEISGFSAIDLFRRAGVELNRDYFGESDLGDRKDRKIVEIRDELRKRR